MYVYAISANGVFEISSQQIAKQGHGGNVKLAAIMLSVSCKTDDNDDFNDDGQIIAEMPLRANTFSSNKSNGHLMETDRESLLIPGHGKYTCNIHEYA